MKEPNTGKVSTPAGASTSQSTLPADNGPLDDEAMTAMMLGMRGQDRGQASANENRTDDEGTADEGAPDGAQQEATDDLQTAAQGTTPEGPASESEGEGQNDLSQDESEPAGAGFDKRIGKFRAALTEVRQENQELREQLRELRQEVKGQGRAGTAPEGNPYANLESPEDVSAMRKHLREFRTWAAQNPQGGEFGGQNLDAERVAVLMNRAEDALDPVDGHLVKRVKDLEVTQQVKAQAEKRWPWLRDPEDPRAVAARNVLKQYGHVALKDIPMIWEWMPRAMEHYLAEANQTKKTQGQPPRIPPKSAASSKASGDASAKDAFTKFMETGSDEDLDKVLAARRRNRRAER